MTLSGRLADGAEFDAIRAIVDGARASDAAVGPGDDAAVLADGTVVSTDVAVEGVHFRAEWIGDAAAGERAVRAALSDLAAMGAHPVAVFASLSGPDRERLVRAGIGVRQGGEAFGASLLGGDLARADGPLTIGVTVLGVLDGRRPWRRSSARPGDVLWVTGDLGAAAAAVATWSSDGVPSDALRDRFARPAPRFAAIDALRTHLDPRAAIDLSDGLAADARHLAAASGVEVVIEAERVPVAPAAVAARSPDDALRLALEGGEDYELLLAAAPSDVGEGADGGEDAVRATSGVPLTRVGRVGEGRGAFLLAADGTRQPLDGGFAHWGAS